MNEDMIGFRKVLSEVAELWTHCPPPPPLQPSGTAHRGISLDIAASWLPVGKGLTSWLSWMWCFIEFLSLSHTVSCPGSGVVLDCIDSWSLPFSLLWWKVVSIWRNHINLSNVFNHSLAQMFAFLYHVATVQLTLLRRKPCLSLML